LLLMVLGISHMLITSRTSGGNPEVERQRKTFEALVQSKQALIAWSIMEGDMGTSTYPRSGVLPCPDNNLFGSAASGGASGSCSVSGGTSVGRLPWKSIGVDRLRDADGEVLWYAVSDNFRSRTDHNKAAVNSDTRGTLRLYAADGITLATPSGEELAAVIFAPGPPLPGQNRTAESAEFTGNKIVSAYLEAFNGKNNASAAGPFIMGPVKDSVGDLVVNDLVIGLTARELIAAMEKRALNEAQKALSQFDTLPKPAPHDDPSCTSLITNVTEAVVPCTNNGSSTCFGRLPENALSDHVPPWFIQNGWGRVMVYAINDAGAGCTTPLNVGETPKRYVLFAPGPARQGQSRPSFSLSDYLEDTANTDGWLGDFDFVVPGGESNDQLRTSP
jgi:hypothetical protein